MTPIPELIARLKSAIHDESVLISPRTSKLIEEVKYAVGVLGAAADLPVGEVMAQQQTPAQFDALRYVIDAHAQTQAQVKHLQANLEQLDRLCARVESLQTNFSDALTVIRAMAEADEDQDSLAVQAMARTFLARTNAPGRSPSHPTSEGGVE